MPLIGFIGPLMGRVEQKLEKFINVLSVIYKWKSEYGDVYEVLFWRLDRFVGKRKLFLFLRVEDYATLRE